MRYKLGANPEWVAEEKKQKAKRIEKWEHNPRSKCKGCGNIIPYAKRRQKFCSQKCNGIFHGKRYKKVSKPKCLNCNQTTKTVRTKFCCSECYLDHKWKQKIQKVQDTGIAPSNQTTAKRIVLKINGHKCSRCGIEEWLGEKVPLVLDHINGNPCEWVLGNLRLVCGNCNMLLPTFCSKNRSSKKNDQKNNYRRDYYRKNGSSRYGDV